MDVDKWTPQRLVTAVDVWANRQLSAQVTHDGSVDLIYKSDVSEKGKKRGRNGLSPDEVSLENEGIFLEENCDEDEKRRIKRRAGFSVHNADIVGLNGKSFPNPLPNDSLPLSPLLQSTQDDVPLGKKGTCLCC